MFIELFERMKSVRLCEARTEFTPPAEGQSREDYSKIRSQEYGEILTGRQEALSEIKSELAANGYRIKWSTANYTVTIYHGTSKEGAEKIRSTHKFDEMSFFSHTRKYSAFGSAGASDYARGGGEILVVQADPRDIHFNSGSGEIEASDGLELDEYDNIWKSPERLNKQERK